MYFLFKQKTAYEMRISDWSSDVCSSDLVLGGLRHCKRVRPGLPDDADAHSGHAIGPESRIGVFRPLLHPSYIPQPNEISAVPSPDDQFTELLGGGVRPVDAQRDVLVHCLDTLGRKFHIQIGIAHV